MCNKYEYLLSSSLGLLVKPFRSYAWDIFKIECTDVLFLPTVHLESLPINGVRTRTHGMETLMIDQAEEATSCRAHAPMEQTLELHPFITEPGN